MYMLKVIKIVNKYHNKQRKVRYNKLMNKMNTEEEK